MKLKSISLKNFHGVSLSQGLSIDDLAHRNIFIGPNNSGKSTVFQFLHYLKSNIETDGFHLHQELNDINAGWWWQHNTSVPISADLLLHEVTNNLGIEQDIFKKLVVDGEVRLQVTVHANKQDDSKCILIVAPLVRIDGQWIPVVKQSDSNPSKLEHFNKNGEYIFSRGSDNCPYHEPASKILKAWIRGLRFFDPVRAVDRGGGSRKMDDGAGLLAELFERQQNIRQTASYATFKKTLLDTLNLLLEPTSTLCFENFEIKGDKETPQMFFYQKDFEGPPIALDNMGTGISELVILMSALVRDKNSGNPMQYFIEEPEIHLHPGLLRRFMHTLKGFTNIQFLISSHSNVVLDALDSDVRVFHFLQRRNGACIVIPCKEIIAQHKLLDSLGVSGSTLLQTNCVIWVEGPSDRLYIRQWLKQVDATLQEGSDYSFAFYGGKILSHHAFASNDIREEDFLSMLEISRFSAVIMDKDLAPHQKEDELRKTKRRIVEEASSDPSHRTAYLTNGREIENDIPLGILRQACCELLKLDKTKFESLVLPGEQRYPEEIMAHLGLDEENGTRKKYINKLSNKVTLANKVVSLCQASKEAQSPDYIEKLAEFIKSSRVLEA